MKESLISRIRNEFKGESYFINNNGSDEFIQSIESRLSNRVLDNIENMAFILFKPDAVKSGNVEPIIERLLSKGFEFRYVDVIISPQEYMFESLYKFNLTLNNSQNQIESWWINRKLYTSGESVIALVTHKSLSGLPLYKSLSSIKGPSTPYLTKPGQVRHDYSACNTAINIMHCSDDPVSSIREFLIFKSIDILNLAFETISHPSDLGGFLALHSSLSMKTHRSCCFFEVVISIVNRLTLMLFCEHRSLIRELVITHNLHGSYMKRLSDSLDILKRYNDNLLTIVSNISLNNSEDILRSLEYLADLEKFDYQRATLVLTTCQRLGMLIDPFDEIIIETSAHYCLELNKAVRILNESK